MRQVVQWSLGATSSFFQCCGQPKSFSLSPYSRRMQVRFSQIQASSPNCFPSFFICASQGRVRTKTVQRTMLQIERCEVCIAGQFRFLLDAAERNRIEYERNIMHSALQFTEFQFLISGSIEVDSGFSDKQQGDSQHGCGINNCLHAPHIGGLTYSCSARRTHLIVALLLGTSSGANSYCLILARRIKHTLPSHPHYVLHMHRELPEILASSQDDFFALVPAMKPHPTPHETRKLLKDHWATAAICPWARRHFAKALPSLTLFPNAPQRTHDFSFSFESHRRF